ncbi:tRNA selenocysteine 1-associated protein 1-like [Teleopsis dalmanni]|uniref:tRNA selenocysteine 1-associated protein 1-like n=1 Tax=Teleopsis dalmanni TaxID=139649 RepID=UPI0018CC9A7D|nr:tRNA selenocysteine 1-associated protein 1-like [Teleopsis dalmanni]
MDRFYIYRKFQEQGYSLLAVRVITSSFTNKPLHCYIQFKSTEAALECLYALDDKPIPGEGPDISFCLDVANELVKDTRPYYGVWLGNLSGDTTNIDIKKAFAANNINVKRAFVIRDRLSNSRGYAFVQFYTEWEQKNSIFKMNNYIGLGGSIPLLVRDSTGPKFKKFKPPQKSSFVIRIFNLNLHQYEREINEFFKQNLPSFRFITRPRYADKTPKNYNIVVFGDEVDCIRAVEMLNGKQFFGSSYLIAVIPTVNSNDIHQSVSDDENDQYKDKTILNWKQYNAVSFKAKELNNHTDKVDKDKVDVTNASDLIKNTILKAEEINDSGDAVNSGPGTASSLIERISNAFKSIFNVFF